METGHPRRDSVSLRDLKAGNAPGRPTEEA
jgi:hypothetical protein